MRSFIWGISAAFAVFASMSAARGDSLLTNGGFELPKTQAASFTVFNPGDDIGGWTAVGTQVAVVDTNFTQGGFAFVAQEGDQWVDMSGFNANSAEGVEQTVITTPGAQYDLSFWVGNVVDASGTFGSSSTASVYLNGILELSATNSDGAGSNMQNWKEFSLPFTATAASTTVRFLNGDPATDNSNGLDNVSLNLASAPPTAIPLPPALFQVTAMGLAWGGIFALTRLRKRRTA